MKLKLENDLVDNETMMRHYRDCLLAESDWTQLPDATVDREAWATYRQALRDFPAIWTKSPEANFPDTP